MPATTHRFLAFDLGAESGRAMLATLSGGRLALTEVHRFRTEGLLMLGTRQWDLARFYEEMITALAKCVRAHGPNLDGIGIDTWGVDFGFIDATGQPVGNPVHYRDKRTQGMIEAVNAECGGSDAVYLRTGITSHSFNTLYQLLALHRAASPQLQTAEKLLFIGNLLSYLLCGVASCEYTIASTSQMLDPRTRAWDRALLKQLGIGDQTLLPIDAPGRVLGPITPEVAAATGLDPATPVILTAIHDTACAVVAAPVKNAAANDWAYLSSGTWSLLGVELDQPLITAEVNAARFTNEGGVGGKIRFLKNIFGLWLVQECRRTWLAEAGGPDHESAAGLDYATLTAEAEKATHYNGAITLEAERLLAPDNMPATIAELCREQGVPIPAARGEFIRCALLSLAAGYRDAIRDLDRITGRTTRQLHIIGGGCQNRLLNQWTADACGIPVIAGPIEATAIGNVIVQALGTGAVKDLATGRALIADSFPVERFTPHPAAV